MIKQQTRRETYYSIVCDDCHRPGPVSNVEHSLCDRALSDGWTFDVDTGLHLCQDCSTKGGT